MYTFVVRFGIKSYNSTNVTQTCDYVQLKFHLRSNFINFLERL